MKHIDMRKTFQTNLKKLSTKLGKNSEGEITNAEVLIDTIDFIGEKFESIFLVSKFILTLLICNTGL